MKIHWHKRAAAQLHQVEEYVLRDFGERIRQEFMDEVEQATHALADMPTMGKIDPLFAHRRQTYRSIIVRRLNKIVYYVKGDALYIAAFWDTRREPKAQARQTKWTTEEGGPAATARGQSRLPFLSSPSPATLKIPQKPQEYREKVVTLHAKHSLKAKEYGNNNSNPSTARSVHG